MTTLQALIAFSFQLLIGLTPAQADEAAERTAIRDEAEQAYRAGDFASLERQHATYSSFLTQRTSSGAFKMTLFADGIGKALRDATESQLQANITLTLSWAAAHNNSPLSHVLHVVALQSYAGYFRGGGFANTVAPQAWKVYEDYTRRAGQYLIDHEAVASRSSSWHAWMLNIAKSGGWPAQVVERLFEAGLQLDRSDYRLYVNTAEYFLPKWYGDAQTLDKFIRYAVAKAPPDYGAELYARLYSGVGETQFQRKLYTDSLVDWSSMREGLALWYQRFPTAWNKNIVAYHACIAGDKALAKQLLDEIGDRPQWEIWQPRAKATFDTCIRWAADPEAEPKSPRTAPAAESKQSSLRAVPNAA